MYICSISSLFSHKKQQLLESVSQLCIVRKIQYIRLIKKILRRGTNSYTIDYRGITLAPCTFPPLTTRCYVTCLSNLSEYSRLYIGYKSANIPRNLFTEMFWQSHGCGCEEICFCCYVTNALTLRMFVAGIDLKSHFKATTNCHIRKRFFILLFCNIAENLLRCKCKSIVDRWHLSGIDRYRNYLSTSTNQFYHRLTAYR